MPMLVSPTPVLEQRLPHPHTHANTSLSRQPDPPPLSASSSASVWEQDASYDGRMSRLRSLPVCVLHRISRSLGFEVPEAHLRMAQTRDEILATMLRRTPDTAKAVAAALRDTVRCSSM
eukprot:362129-Chlamydomonas_euryale.AAC.2